MSMVNKFMSDMCNEIADGEEQMIASTVKLNNSKIIEPCFIGENVVLNNSTVGPNVSIGNDCTLSNVIVKNSLIQSKNTIKNANLDQKYSSKALLPGTV